MNIEIKALETTPETFMQNLGLHEDQFDHSAVSEGIAWSVFEKTSEYLELTRSDIETIYHVSQSTLKRRKKDGRLNTEESDKIYRLVNVTNNALPIFGDNLSSVRSWLVSPNELFGGESPIALTNTTDGYSWVMRVINQLKNGDFV